MEGDKIYNNNFSLIRMVAAFLVFAGHMFVLMGKDTPQLLLQKIQWLGVIIFFVCSGFLITQSWERDRNYFRYLIKRIMRIFPALIVYCLLTACVIGPAISMLPLRDYFQHSLFKDYLKNIILYITYFLPGGVFEGNPYPNAVNGSLWCLSIEFMMYIFVPLIYEWGKLLKGRVIVVITSIVCLLSIVWELYFQDIRIIFYAMDLGQILSIIPYYLLGMMVASLKINKKSFSILTGCVLMIVYSASGINSIVVSNFLEFILIPYIIFSIAFADKGKLGKICEKYELSYGIFLYGFMIQQLIIYLLYKRGIYPTVGLMLVICLGITIICALLSNRCIEQPVNKWIKRLIK